MVSWWATLDVEVEPDLLADLAHARRVAAPLDGVADHVEDPVLARGQAGLVGRTVREVADAG